MKAFSVSVRHTKTALQMFYSAERQCLPEPLGGVEAMLERCFQCSCLLVGNLFKNKTRNPFEVCATGSFTIKINPYCAFFLSLSWVCNHYLFFTAKITRMRNFFQKCS